MGGRLIAQLDVIARHVRLAKEKAPFQDSEGGLMNDEGRYRQQTVAVLL